MLLAYPYFNNNHFEIHTDVGKFQLETVIIQSGQPIFLYIHKITVTKTRHNTVKIYP